MNKPLVVVLGETASGKSGIAMDIARRFNGEIIGADSWTVYREFDIGTAKPSMADQSSIRHHLFDIVDAPDGFNAALYKQRALNAIANIRSRGRLPILVGGTGLYIDSVIYDYEFMAPGDPIERARRNTMGITQLLQEAQSKKIDLGDIDTRNKRRVIRAIETNGQKPSKNELRVNTLVIGVKRDRDTLHDRIAKRVDVMIANGLEREVKHLSEKYGWDVEPMKGIGYAEWRDYFFGTQDLALTRSRIISNTNKLAKRQRTWFKRNNSIQWIYNSDEYVDLVTTLMSKSE